MISRTGPGQPRRATCSRRRLTGAAIVVFAVALVGASCSGSDTASSTSTTAKAVTTAAATAAWQKVIAPSSCMCSDGSTFHYWIHRGDPKKVLFYLEGGGACFSADTCGGPKPTFTTSIANDKGPGAGEVAHGIFDLTNSANPFHGYTMVFVPYCTGDLHAGNATHDYGHGVVIHHNGFINASTALAATAAAFPDASHVVVSGGSAGSAGSPLYAGLAHDVFTKARIQLLSDGSGAFPGDAGITTAIGSLWGVSSVIPPWPENAGLPPTAWSLPGIVVQAGKHVPGMPIAQINTAYDETQQAFAKLAGFPNADLQTMIDENTKSIEAAGVPVHSWVGPGTVHTILTRPSFYTVTVNGTRLRNWVADFVDGKDVPDVHCTDCKKPA
jgi:Pectinacetylesterase